MKRFLLLPLLALAAGCAPEPTSLERVSIAIEHCKHVDPMHVQDAAARLGRPNMSNAYAARYVSAVVPAPRVSQRRIDQICSGRDPSNIFRPTLFSAR